MCEYNTSMSAFASIYAICRFGIVRLCTFLVCVAIAPVVANAQTARLADMAFEDPAFRDCVLAQAKKQAWQATSEVTTLTCHGGKIQSVAELGKFENLKRVSFFRNRIEKFSAGDMPALEHLNLAQNSLQRFDIGAAPALRELYLFRNRLSEFSAVSWPSLAKLRISENRLTAIRLENLPRLEKAYIHDNKLEAIDLAVGLPALKFVDLRINPLPDPVYDVLDAMDGVTIPHDGNAEDWE